MMSRRISSDLTQLLSDLKPLLRRYLEDRGVAIDERGYWSCISPDHADGTASMHFVPGTDEEKFKCWSCGAIGDVCDAYAMLEGTPKSGNRWLHDTVYPLARKYHIPFQEVELTEQQLLELDLYRLHDDAAKVLLDCCEKDPDTGFANTRARGWSDEICKRMVVGSVSWRVFLKKMKACGHDPVFMKTYGIDETMFDKEMITFTIRDVGGQVIGFTRRWVRFDKATAKAMAERGEGHKYPPKYKNTPASVPFFQKESVLYGLDTAKSENFRRLDLFEGHPDVMAARQAGHIPCVCAAGTIITDYGHIEAARAAGFDHINLVADSDPAGVAAAEKYIDDFARIKGLHFTVTFLPFGEEVPMEDRDPDGFFRIYGLEAFLALQPVSIFNWQLHKKLSVPGVDKTKVAEEMVPFILQESSHINRGVMIEQVAARTGRAEMDIRADVAKYENEEVDRIAEDLERRLRFSRDSIERRELIKNYSVDLESLDRGTGDLSIDETVKAFAAVVTDFETPHEGLLGYATGWPRFDEKFDGLRKYGELYGLAGAANSGKSAWVTTLAVNLCAFNPDDPPAVIYHIMDDPRRIAFAKLLSRCTGLPIGHIIRAHDKIFTDPERKEIYERGRNWLTGQMQQGHLIVKGQELGTGTRAASQLIDHVQKTRKVNPIYIADSLHTLSGEGESESERIRVKRVVEWAQHMSDTREITMVFTIELTKAGLRGRPHLETTAETAKIAYSFKAVGMLYNEMHDLGEDQSTTYWTEKVSGIRGKDPSTGAPIPSVKRPILEVNWEKNKISDFKGKMFWRLWPNCAFAEEITQKELEEEREKAKGPRKLAPNLDPESAFESTLPPKPPAQIQWQ